jgi:hypothetical protein
MATGQPTNILEEHVTSIFRVNSQAGNQDEAFGTLKMEATCSPEILLIFDRLHSVRTSDPTCVFYFFSAECYAQIVSTHNRASACRMH